jgi:hypothetical protein
MISHITAAHHEITALGTQAAHHKITALGTQAIQVATVAQTGPQGIQGVQGVVGPASTLVYEPTFTINADMELEVTLALVDTAE